MNGPEAREETAASEKPLKQIREEMLALFVETGSHNMSGAALAEFADIWDRLTIGNYVDCVRKHPELRQRKDMWGDPSFERWSRAAVVRWAKVAQIIAMGGVTKRMHVYLAAMSVVYSTSDKYCTETIPECRRAEAVVESDGPQPFKIVQRACKAFTDQNLVPERFLSE